MRIFVTGASGFVGRAFAARLLEGGHEVVGLVQHGELPEHPNLTVVRGNIGEVTAESFGGGAIDVAVHSAWMATPGEYLTSPVNADFVKWSAELLPELLAAGVRRFVGVGTCLECPPSSERVPEQLSYHPFKPHSPYARAKCECSGILSKLAETSKVSFAWARLFFPFGPGEHPNRLPSILVRELAAGNEIVLKTPSSTKDYIYISDVAEALTVLAESDGEGAFHIGSGIGCRISDFAKMAAREVGASEDLIKIPPADEQMHDDYPYQVADNSRLRQLGWNPNIRLDDGIRDLVLNVLSNETDN